MMLEYISTILILSGLLYARYLYCKACEELSKDYKKELIRTSQDIKDLEL